MNLKAFTPQEMLNEMEAMAVDAAAKLLSGRDELAIAVHKIFTDKLYLAAKDDNGIPLYPNQHAYEPHLLEKLSISRATLYNAYTPAKIACGPTFGLDYEEFVKTGGAITWSSVKNNVDYDQRTGEVKSLKSGELPEDVQIKEFVLEAVKDVAPTGPSELNLQPGEINKALDVALSIGEKPVITFSRKIRDDHSRVTMYGMEKKGQTFIGNIDAPEVPEEVEEEYKRRLKIY